MERQMPVVVSAGPGRLGEVFEEGASREDLALSTAGIGNIPVMF
jgi:hypothetical protein